MKNQRVRHKASLKKFKGAIPIGIVLTEIVIWDFSGNEEIISHNAGELAKALLMTYQLNNFGPISFGLDDKE